MSPSRLAPLLLTCALACFALPGWAGAATFTVATDGVDSGGCGAKDDPCRSINFAIGAASPGDKIVVGPGTYTAATEPPAACGTCLVFVDKAVQLESVTGAGTTILDAQNLSLDVIEVDAGASDARIGKKKKGFTLTRSLDRTGLVVGVGAAGVRVQGNVATANGEAGFDHANDELMTDNVASGNGGRGFVTRASSSGAKLQRNISSDNDGSGFRSEAASGPTSYDKNQALENNSAGYDLDGALGTFKNNQAVRNGARGFDFRTQVGATIQSNLAQGNSGEGFDLTLSNDNTLVGNVAASNNVGFEVTSGTGNVFTKNASVGNRSDGFNIQSSGGDAVLTDNASIGNTGSGLRTTASPITIEGNNFFGNDDTGSNCGVEADTGTPIVATNNYWGAATGPGADPADDACAISGSITSAPFAASAFKIPIKLGK